MWKTIAESLDAGGGESRAVTEHLGDRQALLVLDNLEQLDGAAEVVAALLSAAPHVVVLATSRLLFCIFRGSTSSRSRRWRCPATPAYERWPGARRLSCSSSRRVWSDRVSRSPAMLPTSRRSAGASTGCRWPSSWPRPGSSRSGPGALLTRLDHSLGLSGADLLFGRPSRQQTLRNTIAWSYDLLEPDIAAAFRRAGVFAGGCDLDALAAVAVADGDPAGSDPLDLVAALLDVSLITVTEGADGEPRVAMLETIREYALERLAEAGDKYRPGAGYAQHYAAFAEQAAQQLNGREHLAWLDRLEAEHDNLRAALSWSLETGAADGERVATGTAAGPGAGTVLVPARSCPRRAAMAGTGRRPGPG